MDGGYSPKRKSEFEDTPAPKMAKIDARYATMSFAERMMAKMGHKQGQGLGQRGEGITAFLEDNTLRPKGAGIGVISEKSHKTKDEERRQAEKNGEVYHDSSEEERKAKKEQKALRAKGIFVSKPVAKPKVNNQTASDLEKAAQGLEIPQVLKTIIDATGPTLRTLDSAAGLLKSASTPQQIEAEKLAQRARRDLEAYANSWNELTARAKELDIEEEDVAKGIEQEEQNLFKYQHLVGEVKTLFVEDDHDEEADRTSQWEQLVTSLEILENKYRGEVSPEILQHISVAAIQPLFKRAMIEWNPLEDPISISLHLRSIAHLLYSKDEEKAIKKSTTAYETLIYTSWLPNIRSTIINEWAAYNPTPLLSVIEAWKSLLPDFILENVINNLVVKKLTVTLQSWNPRTSKSVDTLPHVWLFPWLPYLAAEHVDATNTTGLLSEVNGKLRVVFDSWNIDQGILPGIDQWVVPLGSKLESNLVKHLLPRLAKYLSRKLEINPTEQDLTPLEKVLAWKNLLPERAMAQLLVVEFFPKWLDTLHQWLSSDMGDYGQIAEWYRWWREQIPLDLNQWRGLNEMWIKGLNMMMAAIDLGDSGKADLPQPDTDPAFTIPAKQPSPKESTPMKKTKSSQQHPDDEAKFRDVVELWCEDNGLFLVALREAHEHGHPLFRITASATLRGGVVVYFKGDIVWARKRGEVDSWERVALDEDLVQRGEKR